MELKDKKVKDLTSEEILDIVTDLRDCEELGIEWEGVLDTGFILHNYLTDEGLSMKRQRQQRLQTLE